MIHDDEDIKTLREMDEDTEEVIDEDTEEDPEEQTSEQRYYYLDIDSKIFKIEEADHKKYFDSEKFDYKEKTKRPLSTDLLNEVYNFSANKEQKKPKEYFFNYADYSKKILVYKDGYKKTKSGKQKNNVVQLCTRGPIMRLKLDKVHNSLFFIAKLDSGMVVLVTYRRLFEHSKSLTSKRQELLRFFEENKGNWQEKKLKDIASIIKKHMSEATLVRGISLKTKFSKPNVPYCWVLFNKHLLLFDYRHLTNAYQPAKINFERLGIPNGKNKNTVTIRTLLENIIYIKTEDNQYEVLQKKPISTSDKSLTENHQPIYLFRRAIHGSPEKYTKIQNYRGVQGALTLEEGQQPIRLWHDPERLLADEEVNKLLDDATEQMLQEEQKPLDNVQEKNAQEQESEFNEWFANDESQKDEFEESNQVDLELMDALQEENQIDDQELIRALQEYKSDDDVEIISASQKENQVDVGVELSEKERLEEQSQTDDQEQIGEPNSNEQITINEWSNYVRKENWLDNAWEEIEKELEKELQDSIQNDDESVLASHSTRQITKDNQTNQTVEIEKTNQSGSSSLVGPGLWKRKRKKDLDELLQKEEVDRSPP